VAVATTRKRRQVPALRAHRVVLPALSEARVVSEKVLLTGRPGCGKTTLIKRVVNNLSRRAGGFYTEEIRDGGTRAGFKIVTLDGEEVVFAHIDLKTPEHLGKYRLDVSALERIGVEAVREAVRRRRLVIIDEIGPMEIRSAIFRDAVNEALDSEVPVIATIFARTLPFTDAIKSRPDVTSIEVRPDNRERLVSELADRIQALNPG
jgi:nucleoside-triphosphatase